MTGLSSLLIPILLSSVVVFVASSLLHMVTPWHKNDYGRVPNEDQLRDLLRPLAIPPGDYMVPRPSSRAEMKSSDFAEKFRQGPNLVVTVLPSGSFGIARNLVLWFLYLLVVSLFAAFVAGRALPPAAGDRQIVKFVGATAFLGYTAALWQMSIWYRRSWNTTIKSTVDGIIYALLTAAVFWWLWPQ